MDGLDKSPQRLQAEDTKDTHASDDREGKIGWIGREGILQQAKRGIIRWNAARSKVTLVFSHVITNVVTEISLQGK